MLAPDQFAILDHSALPALRTISVIAVMIYAAFGAWIFRKRHQLFGRDPEVPGYEDGPGVRHIRLELVLIVWGTLMILMLATLYSIWNS